jgi:hypothetical protein
MKNSMKRFFFPFLKQSCSMILLNAKTKNIKITAAKTLILEMSSPANLNNGAVFQPKGKPHD